MDTKKLLNKGNVKMVAHRGLSGLETENTLAAFIAAGNRSFYGIETDVHHTVDGNFVIIHDDHTGRVGCEDIHVDGSTVEEIQKIYLHSNTGEGRCDMHIPTLEDYIRTCKKYEKYCILELKEPYSKEQAVALIDRINREDYLDRVIFISFWIDNIIAIRELLPDQKIQFLTCEINDDCFEILKKYRFDLDCLYHALTKEWIDRVHAEGLEVNAWTCDSVEDAERLVAMGVDYITSNIIE